LEALQQQTAIVGWGVKWKRLRMKFKDSNTKNKPEKRYFSKNMPLFSLCKDNLIYPTPKFNI